MAETPPNASPRPAVTPWRRPNLQLSHGGLQQQWPAASTVHGSGSSSGASSGSSSGAGSHRQRRVSEVMPRDCLITPAHAARGLGMLAAVARDRGSERGVTARPEAGSRGHAPSATNAEVKFSDVGGHIRGARHGRQQRLVGGPGGDPHLGGYLGRRPEGWQRRRGAQSQPRLRPTPAGRKSGSTLPPFDLRIIRLCMSTSKTCGPGRRQCGNPPKKVRQTFRRDLRLRKLSSAIIVVANRGFRPEQGCPHRPAPLPADISTTRSTG